MPQVYTAEFLSENDVYEQQWSDDHFPDARKTRDRKARELRKGGWVVEVGKYDYTDLGRFILYWLVAIRSKKG